MDFEVLFPTDEFFNVSLPVTFSPLLKEGFLFESLSVFSSLSPGFTKFSGPFLLHPDQCL